MPQQRAFTLLELLVVVAILAVLVAVLFPVISTARTSALSAKDLSNIRSFQLAHVLYYQDHRGCFLDVGLPHGGTHEAFDVAWVNTLQSYYDTELLLRSPLDRSPHWPSELGGLGVEVPNSNGRFRLTSYGCNDFLSRALSPVFAVSGDPSDIFDRLARVPNPSATVQFVMMAFEGEFAGSDHVHASGWWLSPAQPNFPPMQAASEMQTNAVAGKAGSWDARANYGFLDGHVETLKFHEVYVDRDERNRFDPRISGLFNTRRALIDG